MFQLSAEGLEVVKKELERYETRQSAIIPALYQAQAENGWISPDVINHLSEVMEIPASQIDEVSKFYTMFNQKPVGKYHVQVCTNVSCAMAGTRELAEHICKRLEVEEGEVTRDGKFTVSRVECLGSCGTAPMIQVNDDYHENLTEEKVDTLLGELK